MHAALNRVRPLPELALLPAGGANNIAVSLGIPLALREAAVLAAEGQARTIDLIDATVGDYGLNRVFFEPLRRRREPAAGGR